MPAASMFAPTVSPASVFEPEPESPGEIAPKNMKCVRAPRDRRARARRAARDAEAGAVTVVDDLLREERVRVRVTWVEQVVARGTSSAATAPVFVNTPRGPPQNAIVGVTRLWYAALIEISAQSLPTPPSPVDARERAEVEQHGRASRLPTAAITVALSPVLPQWPAVLIW